MSLQVIFDRILGRLREKDYDTGGGGTPSVPSPQDHFSVTTTPDNQSYYADQRECPGLTVRVELTFDGEPVDPGEPHPLWTKISDGVYERHLDAPGTVASEEWTYTPGGVYEQGTARKNSKAVTLTAKYPAYWGLYPGNDTTNPDITAVVAELYEQGRIVTNNMVNHVVNVPNNTNEVCWLWIVTKANATAVSNVFNTSVVLAPVSGMEFTSPRNPQLNMDGYNAYVSQLSIKDGSTSGELKLNINVAHTP